jgi:hypothetical protein
MESAQRWSSKQQHRREIYISTSPAASQQRSDGDGDGGEESREPCSGAGATGGRNRGTERSLALCRVAWWEQSSAWGVSQCRKPQQPNAGGGGSTAQGEAGLPRALRSCPTANAHLKPTVTMATDFFWTCHADKHVRSMPSRLVHSMSMSI